MRSDDLTPEQAAPIYAQLREMLTYLYKLRARMEERQFSDDDPLYVATSKAWEAIHTLTGEWHYIVCNRASWKLSPKRDGDESERP